MNGEIPMKIFISCVKSKLDDNELHPASELYVSTLFKKSLQYARTLTTDDNIFILSAKYGLVPLDRQIRSYNLTLKDMPKNERKRWAYSVIKQCEKIEINRNEEIVFLAGRYYSEYLSIYFKNNRMPLGNLSMGNRVKWLTEQLEGVKK